MTFERPRFESNAHDTGIHGGTSSEAKRFPDYTSLLDPTLARSRDEFLQTAKDNLSMSEAGVEVVRHKIGNYLATRQERGKDLESDEVDRARDMAHRYFDEVVTDRTNVIWELCMDGRTRKTIIAGVPGRFGGSQRFPGAKPPGFERNKSGTLRLDRNSTYARTTRRELSKGRNFAFIVDSHRNCAARGAEERTKYLEDSADGGLLADIQFKREMMRAHRGFIQDAGLKPETLLYVPITFSPEGEFAGYTLLGLDREAARRNAANHDGYTQSTLEHQINRGTILSLKQLAEEGELAPIFDKFKIPGSDWKTNYKTTSLNFWRNINAMKDEALPLLKDRLRAIYEGDEALSDQELDMTARVALVSGYAGKINNSHPGGYQYGTHEESILVALEGGDHGPFDAAESLEIYRESNRLADDAVLGTSIIGENRKQGRAAGKPSDPVPLIIQIGRGNAGRDQLISFANALKRELPKRGDLRDMSEMALWEFALDIDGNLPGEFVLEFVKASRALATLFRGDSQHYDVFKGGRIVPFPLVVGGNKEPIVPLPLHV